MAEDTQERSDGRLPDFVIIGAAKSGTSTLYQYLSRHPAVFMSPIKEPCFFDAQVAWDNGVQWYRSLFRDALPGQICGEASTNYTRYPQVDGVPERMRQLIPGAKLIYMLRHPVDRAYSHYVHRHLKEVYPGLPFREGFEEFVAHDPMCIDSSDYAKQIEQYLKVFPKEQLLILRMEELRNDLPGLLRRTLSFLGVDAGVDLIQGQPVVDNEATQFREDMLRRFIMGPVHRVGIVRRVIEIVPKEWKDGLYKAIRQSNYGKKVGDEYTPPPMKPETRRALLDRFAASNTTLKERFGVDTSAWEQ